MVDTDVEFKINEKEFIDFGMKNNNKSVEETDQTNLERIEKVSE